MTPSDDPAGVHSIGVIEPLGFIRHPHRLGNNQPSTGHIDERNFFCLIRCGMSVARPDGPGKFYHKVLAEVSA